MRDPLPSPGDGADLILRRGYKVTGAVQGVGFRPFVYRLAMEGGLAGHVFNTPDGVTIEVEGAAGALHSFRHRLETELPPAARVDRCVEESLVPQGGAEFVIRPSEGAGGGGASALVLADLSPCPACLEEIRDPTARRYRYPFTSCTHCGPRFTIMTALPYDRPSTTLASFPLCADCQREYEDPLDRRFHAQPLACPVCGPHLALWSKTGESVAEREDALQGAVEALRTGHIVALKGVGGFHLLADARGDEALGKLRERKGRPAKPFAVMVGSLTEARRICDVSPLEAEVLTSTAAPLVLLHEREGNGLSPRVAPGNPTLGVMLPSSPLHALLLEEFGGPVIATSGNRASEPVCIEEGEALERLGGIADLFLVHNRPIAHRADDSIVRVMAGRPVVLRRARGYAPMPLEPVPLPEDHAPLLGLGPHLKNTVTLLHRGMIVSGPHVGDLDTLAARAAHRRAQDTLTGFYGIRAPRLVGDLHPDAGSASGARGGAGDDPSTLAIQHHYAHALTCLADNGLPPSTSALAVVWDGTGYGADGTAWGGEFLRLLPEGGSERFAHLLPFPLIGGDLAARFPARAALGMLVAMGKAETHPVPGLAERDRALMLQAAGKGINCPPTSSAGRLFDGVAGLLGLCTENTFEGQAAQAVEFAAEAYRRRAGKDSDPEAYPCDADALISGDWRPLVDAVLQETDSGRAAARFQSSLVRMIVGIARKSGEKHILLTGGCFQNKALLEETVVRLRAQDLEPLWHRQIPPNDGGVSVGQVMGGLLLQQGD